MKLPPTPLDEDLRLKDLYSFDVLYKEAEAGFDEFTLLASNLLNVPIALISLITEDEQWFLSKKGLDVCSTDRDVSFCGHAVYEKKTFIVNDTTKDERFLDNPLVLGDPHIRFYAGEPLISENGFVLGTLCAIDVKPRQFSEEEKGTLKRLARLVMIQLEARKRISELEKEVREKAIALEQINNLSELTGNMAAVAEVHKDGVWFIFKNSHTDKILECLGSAQIHELFLSLEEVQQRDFPLSHPDLGDQKFNVRLNFLGRINERSTYCALYAWRM